MKDVTGNGWAVHMRHGTSRLLSLRSPHHIVESSDQNLYLTVRMYEVIRALAYHETTVLDHVAWQGLKNSLLLGQTGSNGSHPIDDLIGLMTSISGLLDRYDDLCYIKLPDQCSDLAE